MRRLARQSGCISPWRSSGVRCSVRKGCISLQWDGRGEARRLCYDLLPTSPGADVRNAFKISRRGFLLLLGRKRVVLAARAWREDGRLSPSVSLGIQSWQDACDSLPATQALAGQVRRVYQVHQRPVRASRDLPGDASPPEAVRALDRYLAVAPDPSPSTGVPADAIHVPALRHDRD